MKVNGEHHTPHFTLAERAPNIHSAYAGWAPEPVQATEEKKYLFPYGESNPESYAVQPIA
jgi:hypothetical protein